MSMLFPEIQGSGYDPYVHIQEPEQEIKEKDDCEFAGQDTNSNQTGKPS